MGYFSISKVYSQMEACGELMEWVAKEKHSVRRKAIKFDYKSNIGLLGTELPGLKFETFVV